MQLHATQPQGKDVPQGGKKSVLKQPVSWPPIVLGIVVLVAVLGFMYYHVLVAPGQPSDRQIPGHVTKPPPGLPNQWPYNTKEWQTGWNMGLAIGPDGKNKFGTVPKH